MATESAPKYWRDIKRLYRLLGAKCRRCGRVYFPPRDYCYKCGSREVAEHKLSEKGRLLTYTVIRTPPRGFEEFAPYVVGLVELDDGVKVLSQIVDCSAEELYSGMPVELVFRKIKEGGEEGVINYGYKFRPAS